MWFPVAVGVEVREENEKYVMSKARTNKLWCSDCKVKISIGETVVFKLDTIDEKMKDVYCSTCCINYEAHAVEDEQHPFDLE